MLRVQQLSVDGRRDELLPATSLQVRRGELLLVTGKRQDQRTTLALALSGRFKPAGGHFEWDGTRWNGSTKIKALRQASAVVDSPGVNEPEQHLSVRDLVTEDLALVPRRYRGSLLSKPWLKINRFEDIADLWTEQLPAARRIELLTALALANPNTDLLVVDSPDRHGDPNDWLPRLQELAYDAGRPLAVVATVLHLPDGWTGPAAEIGNAATPADTATEPEPEPLEAPTTSETEDAK
ncbi:MULTISPECIES: ABC transporter ATP-binding protein [unclassified Arthrobacter]|uniref:ABC transporter ATP-binding protein n=1 Tax=unclassified Arthrobacter TaxID=235627 RepID=UPI002E0271B5|nr:MULTISPECIES: ABC transporter ATP-binding protein [unclassified Arthrobacter]MEC5191953.1 ABC-type branched-subunit amino acid transport system ATPase component [Arthrobacter sp. MP_M4]MEC5203528.1 ABC-type branched-subunit amino acid transport system ATPase component [Arthrobacter sp. MP_M7]